ncbi:hypothetical protein HPHPP41_1182 [Helicobacter pylori Hp P-41]|nr:hypothetical protein HPHPP41_1182 [Helicobacter pylori Hp P-41]
MKIKLTLKTPFKTPYKGNKVTTIETLFTKKKKRDLRGISVKFWGVFKNAFWHFQAF